METLIRWFLANPIAAKLLMICVIVGGVSSISSIPKEFFPERQLDRVSVSVIYPGAGPQEVEQQVIARIEDAIKDLDGIDEIRSTARESNAQVTIDVESGYETQRLVADIKSRVDAINTFPAEAERPQVSEQTWKSRIVSVALAGDIGEANLKELAEQVRDEMSALPSVSLVEVKRPRNYEISIEVSEQNLRRYGLSIDEVARAIRNSSLNLPAGKIRTEGGDIQLQTRAQGYNAADFENIVVLSRTDGTKVRVSDVATIRDDFEELDVVASFDEKPSLSIDVYVTKKPDVLKVTDEVKTYVSALQTRLPPNVTATVWQDMSIPYRDRIDTMVSNGWQGMLLVYLLLLMFLRPILAWWVSTGIPIAILGALFALPLVGVSMNMVSLFGFILVLGILVDDAIVIGESVYTAQQRGHRGVKAAEVGATAVAWPVFFSVICTMIYFLPMLFLPGNAPEPKSIAWVVIFCLAFSLIETMLVLPSHLARLKEEQPPRNPLLVMLNKWRSRLAEGMVNFAQNRYRPFLEKCMQARALTITSFLMVLFVCLSIMGGGWLGSSFFPKVPLDTLRATAILPEGVAFGESRKVLEQVESAAEKVRQQYNVDGRTVIDHVEAVGENTRVVVTMQLGNYTDLGITSLDVADTWRDFVGEVQNVEDFTISASMGEFGKPIEILIASPNVNELREASERVKEKLESYAGVVNVRSTLENPRPEIQLRLKPEAKTLQLTEADLAQQVRRGFYGEEVQRVPREREDVKVMVRYPEAERVSEDFLQQMRVRTPDGREVPFETVASVEYVPSYREIERIDGKRSIKVTADILPGTTASPIIRETLAAVAPALQAKYPQLTVAKYGDEQRRGEFLDALQKYFLMSIVVNLGLLAILFRSFKQTFLILSAIPFGVMGAVLGHLIMGQDFSMFSFLGILATAGIASNNNIVLIDHINTLRREQDLPLREAILQAASDRFRAIVLTSCTTFIGSAPLMFGATGQSQFLVPMIISLSYGSIFATFVTLLFTPCLYLAASHLNATLKARFFRRDVTVSTDSKLSIAN